MRRVCPACTRARAGSSLEGTLHHLYGESRPMGTAVSGCHDITARTTDAPFSSLEMEFVQAFSGDGAAFRALSGSPAVQSLHPSVPWSTPSTHTSPLHKQGAEGLEVTEDILIFLVFETSWPCCLSLTPTTGPLGCLPGLQG